MIIITEKALAKLKAVRTEEKKGEDTPLRISVKGGGCSGLMYNLEFENSEEPGDHVVMFEDFEVRINKKSLLYIAGTTLDYSDGLNGKGFVFNNPMATRSCGCGESFSI